MSIFFYFHKLEDSIPIYTKEGIASANEIMCAAQNIKFLMSLC